MACVPLAALGACKITYEEASEFATPLVGLRAFYDLPVQEDRSMTFTDERVELTVLQQKIDGYAGALPGPRTVEFSCTVPLHGTGIVGDDGNPSPIETDTALGLLLSIVFGGFSGGNVGSNVDSAAGPHLVTPAANALNPGGNASFRKGGVIGHVNSFGAFQPRSIADVDTGEVHIKTDFYDSSPLTPTAPTAEDDLYSGSTIYPVRCPQRTIQMIVCPSDNQNDRWLLMGGQIESAPTLTRELGDSGSVPTMQFTITFADFQALAPAPLEPADYQNFIPILTTPSHLSIKAAGLETDGETQISYVDECTHGTISYTLNAPVFQRLASACAPNGVGAWVRSRAVPFAEIAISVPFEDMTFFDHWLDRDQSFAIHDQIGTVPGLTWLIDIPRAELVGYGREEQEGAAFQTLTFATRLDDSIVDQDPASDLETAAFRMHML